MSVHNNESHPEPKLRLKDLSTEELVEQLGKNCGQPYLEGQQSLEDYLVDKTKQVEHPPADADFNDR